MGLFAMASKAIQTISIISVLAKQGKLEMGVAKSWSGYALQIGLPTVHCTGLSAVHRPWLFARKLHLLQLQLHVRGFVEAGDRASCRAI